MPVQRTIFAVLRDVTVAFNVPRKFMPSSLHMKLLICNHVFFQLVSRQRLRRSITSGKAY